MGFEPPILPTTAAEQLYTVAVVLFGVVVAAFVVGSATSIVASMDAISSKRKHELRLLEQYMHSRQVPHALRQRVVGFYEYVTGALALYPNPHPDPNPNSNPNSNTNSNTNSNPNSNPNQVHSSHSTRPR